VDPAKNGVIVTNNFTISFWPVSTTYWGFDLIWSCTDWGEWVNLDGTCNQVQLPAYNNENVIGALPYRRINGICGILFSTYINFELENHHV